MDIDRLQLLLLRYFDQLLAESERLELERMLLDSPMARSAFWDAARWNSLFREWGEVEWGRREVSEPNLYVLPSPSPVQREETQRPRIPARVATHRSGGAWPLSAAAALILSGMITWIMMSGKTPGLAPKVAQITRESDVVWAAGNGAPPIGEKVAAGWLRLKSGIVKIKFAHGADVVLEGPAEFQIVSDTEGFLRSGKVRAHVPEAARGFSIRGPGFSAVDYGTEFGCMVPLLGPSEVHVFTGLVKVQGSRPDAVPRPMKANQAVRIDHAQSEELQAIPVNRTEFISDDEMTRRELVNAHQPLAAWQLSSNALITDPAVLVHFDFEPTAKSSDLLPNRIASASNTVLSGAGIVGCSWSEGRWPGKDALEFNHATDRLQFAVPGNYEAVTLMTWVRVDDLQNNQNSLLMGQSFKAGELHWYIYGDGRVGLGIRTTAGTDPADWKVVYSPPVIQNALGSWVFLVTTFDSVTGNVTHYLNGKPLGKPGYAESHVPVAFDTFEIGNWGVQKGNPAWDWVKLPEQRSYVRNFHGSMDEFSVLSRSLSSEEIAQLYMQGKSEKN